MEKLCAHCKTWKDKEEFSIMRNGKLHSWCRACNTEAKREFRKREKERSHRGGDGMQVKNYVDKFSIGKFICF